MNNNDVDLLAKIVMSAFFRSQFLLICQENGDSVSAKMFESIIDDEQAHFNYFDSVNDHINKLGDTYLAKIAGTSASTGLAPKGFAVNEGGG